MKHKNNRGSALEALKALKSRGFLVKNKQVNKYKLIYAYSEIAQNVSNQTYANFNRVTPPFEYDFGRDLVKIINDEIDYESKRKSNI